MRYHEILGEADDVESLHRTLGSANYPAAAFDPSVANYTGRSSRRLNNRFLGKKPFWGRTQDNRTTQGLLKLIAQSPPLQQPITVWSNTGAWNALTAIQQNTLVTKPFTSTTLDYGFAFKFGAAGTSSKANIILRFDLPAGYHEGVYVGHAESSSQNQKEYLLAPGQRWKVLGTRRFEQGGIQWTIVRLAPE